ncbi:MAG TPA: hypothetical protein VJ885_15535, partial [Thermoanaerobaculia bacterium]|nr:hypothetical protein [Thermoanaerobaculia bacterium]
AYLNWSPVWSPDGRYLYYASDRSGSMNLWRIRIDEDSGKVRGVPEPLTAPASWTGPLTLSHDGRHILYAILEQRSNLARVALNPEGSAVAGPLEPVTEGSRSIRSGRVSPDGKWISFRTASPQEDLFVIQPDGTGLRQLTNDAFRDRGPSWLADGRIVFFSDRSGRYEIWAIRPDGSGLEQLTATKGDPIFSPLGAPDGRRLVCGIGFNRLGLVDLSLPLDRRGPRPLPSPDSGSFFANSWSPDGSQLAGVIRERNLALFSFATRRYEDLGVPGHDPVWTPDGRRLLFLREGTVRALDPRTRQETEVFVPPPGSSFSAPDLSPDGRILYLVRETEEGDIGMATMQSPEP